MEERGVGSGEGRTTPGAFGADDRLSGRLGIVVDGKTVAVLRMDGGGAALEPAEGATRASVLVTSMDDLKKIARGEVNLIVASLRGSLSVRGDVAFAVRALRALEGGIPVEGAGQGWKAQGG